MTSIILVGYGIAIIVLVLDSIMVGRRLEDIRNYLEALEESLEDEE